MNWLIFLLLGLSAGIVIGVLIDKDTVYRGIVKIKQKGRGNTQSPEITANFKEKRASRKAERLERKKARLEKRASNINKK